MVVRDGRRGVEYYDRFRACAIKKETRVRKHERTIAGVVAGRRGGMNASYGATGRLRVGKSIHCLPSM